MTPGRLKARTRGRPPAPGLAWRALRFALQALGAVLGLVRAGWRGELPLWLAAPTFAGLCWAVSPLYSALYELSPPGPWRVVEPVLLWAWALSLWLALLWAGVGVWRCVRSSQQGGGSALMGVGALALVLAVVAQAVAAARDVGCVAGSVWRETWPDRPAGGSEAQDAFWARAVMRYDAANRTLWVTGAVERGTADEFIAALTRHPQVQTIGLVSPGGYVVEAQTMVKQVRARQLDTFAPGPCASACVSLFAAGEQRWVSPQSSFGLHRSGHACFSDTGPSAADLEEATALREAGVTEAFVRQMLETPYQSLWRPDLRDVLASGLASGVRDPR